MTTDDSMLIDGMPAGDLYAGRGAELYDLLCREDRSEIREILEAVRDCGTRILELAAGSGRITLPLSRIADRVVAVDISRDLLAILRNRLEDDAIGNVQPVLGDILELRLGQRFDVAVLGTTTIAIFGSSERQRVYDTIRAHLAPGARVVLSLFEADPATPRLSAMALDGRVEVQSIRDDAADERLSVVTEFDDAGNPVGRYAGRTHLLTARQLGDELVAAGFTAVEIRRLTTPPDFAGTAHSLITARQGE